MRGLASNSFTSDTEIPHTLPRPSTTMARASKSCRSSGAYEIKNLRNCRAARFLLDTDLYFLYSSMDSGGGVGVGVREGAGGGGGGGTAASSALTDLFPCLR